MGIRELFSRGSMKGEAESEKTSNGASITSEHVEVQENTPQATSQVVASSKETSPMRVTEEGEGRQEAPRVEVNSPSSTSPRVSPTSTERGDLEDEEEEAPRETRSFPPYKNPHELLSLTLPARARSIDARLKSNLLGSVEIVLKESNAPYRYDWSGEQLVYTQGAASDNGRPPADCTITISGTHLMKIASGDLNAQIAMLSDKIQVVGKTGLGIYFFNLVAPRGR